MIPIPTPCLVVGRLTDTTPRAIGRVAGTGLQALSLAAPHGEGADEANRLARSYQRAARSYRQTLALKARLQRDLAAAARVQATTPRPKPGVAAVARRIGELRTALTRLAWDEAERPEDERPETE